MRKRVSIVRTLVDDSVDVILMDEPFGPLDAQTRLVLQDELLRLWQGTGRTIVFVTHDIVEAIALSDRIAIFTSVPGPHQGNSQCDAAAAARCLPYPRDAGLLEDIRRDLERPARRNPQGASRRWQRIIRRSRSTPPAIRETMLLAREEQRVTASRRTETMRIVALRRAGDRRRHPLVLVFASGTLVDGCSSAIRSRS